MHVATTSPNRVMPKFWFSQRVGNNQEGTDVNRFWLLNSPKNYAAYCSCGLLFITLNPAAQ